MLAEEELVEIALLRYAQQRATKWGAERFAAEFQRRELEERWLEAARSSTTPYGPPSTADATPSPSMSGPVDASAQEVVVGSDRDAWVLSRPKYARHSSVPRPPVEEPGDEPKRSRRRRKGSLQAPGRRFSPAEVAGMSAAGRRLYGLDDPPGAA
jgi:hypothetical protein